MRMAILVIVGYLVGSVPFGLIIAAAHGKELRKIGSGNIGATNLSRALGKKWGYVCFCLDVLKGLVPMLLAAHLVGSPPGVKEQFSWLAVGCAAVAGHIFPLYVRFRGGKGVATSFGVALGLWPYYTICAVFALAVWVLVVLASRYVSLASISAALAFPVALVLLVTATPAWDMADLWPLLAAAVGIPVAVVARHRENLKRLLRGTEHKITR